MGTKLTPDQLATYKRIDEILYYEWNPIGDNELPKDEYHQYLPQVFSLKIHNADIDKIAAYLYQIETENIGVAGNIQHCKMVAGMIHDL
jgi:hypothetical protein